MHRSHFPVSNCRGVAPLLLLVFCLAFLGASPLLAQSTFGSILGTVHDSAGRCCRARKSGSPTPAPLPSAQPSPMQTAATPSRTSTWAITRSPSLRRDFRAIRCLPSRLTARETRRMDAVLKLGAATQTVVVLDEALRRSSPQTFPTWLRPRSATSSSSFRSPSTPDPQDQQAPSPRSQPRPECRPTTAATGRDAEPRRLAQRHHRRHLIGGRRSTPAP